MRRRNFLKNSLSAATILGAHSTVSATENPHQKTAAKYHLRYAPHLTIVSRELSIPQRLELIAEHGFDATEYNGLLNHPLNEVEEMRKKLDSLKIEMGIFVALLGGGFAYAWKSGALDW